MKYAFFNNKIKVIFITSFVMGIVFGTVLVNCMNRNIATDFFVYYRYLIDKCKWTGIEFKSFYVFLLKKWLKEIVLLVILGLTSYKIIFHNMYILYQGIKMSVLISILTMMNGTSAIIYYLLIYGIPQIIFAYLVISIVNEMDFKSIRDVNRRVKTGLKWLAVIMMLALIESGINILLFAKII